MSAEASTKTQGGTLKRYRELCQKGSAEILLFDKYVFRPISIFPTIAFIKLGIQPNTATFISFVAALASVVCFFSHDPAFMLAGALLAFVYYTLDHVDGELARYYIRTGQRKPELSGAYFDAVVHSYSSNLMLFAFGMSLGNEYGYRWAPYLGFVACIGVSNFAELVAARMLVQKLVQRPETLTDPDAQKALKRIELLEDFVKAVGNVGFNLTTLKKIVRETLGFPGNLILIIVAAVVDALTTGIEVGGLVIDARLVVITVMAVVHGLKSAVYLRAWLKLLRPIR